MLSRLSNSVSRARFCNARITPSIIRAENAQKRKIPVCGPRNGNWVLRSNTVTLMTRYLL